MNTKKRDNNVASFYDDDFESTIWEHALENGMFIPTTIDEVEKMEEILKGEKLLEEPVLISVDTILNRDSTSSFETNTESSFNLSDSYGIAARKGQTISDEAKEKMETLKNNSKKKT